MKKQILLATLGLALCACRSDDDLDDEYAQSRAEEAARTAREASAPAPGPFGRLDAYSAKDREFLVNAAQSGLLAVEASRIALQKLPPGPARDYASRIAAEHGLANEELAQVVEGKAGMLPGKLDTDHQQELERLNRLEGAEFERAYMDFLEESLEDRIRMYETAAREADDPAVRSFANRMVASLRQRKDQLEDQF